MVVGDVKHCFKTITCQQQKLIYCSDYQFLTVIIAKQTIIESGKYVSLEQMFTTLTIISVVASRVLAIQRYRHSRGDDRGCKGSIQSSKYPIQIEQYSQHLVMFDNLPMTLQGQSGILSLGNIPD